MLSIQQSLQLYRSLYLVRASEESIITHYSEDDMKTPMHMSMGGEAIAVGVCSALGKDAQVFSTYRSHAVYLARTGESDSFFAELYGKRTGGAKGKAGSMHLSAPQAGFFGASAIVGSTLPLAVGAAFANVYRGKKTISATFFGDGAVDEGVFWESLNMSAVFNIPTLFVYEDNGFAVHNPKHKRHGYPSIEAIVEQFRCAVIKEESTDVEKIYSATQKAIGILRKSKKPVFLSTRYYRYLEHVGINTDFDVGYRTRKEFDAWGKNDPVKSQRVRLLKRGVSERRIFDIEKKIDEEIARSVRKAQKASFAHISELHKDVFYG